MAKSIKLKDENYIDSTGITYNRKKLNIIIDSLSDILKFQYFQKEVIIGGNGNTSVQMGAINIPTGYSLLGFVAQANGFSDQWIITYSQYGANCVAYVKSYYPGDLTNTISCYAIYVKTSYYNNNYTY